MPRPHGKQAVSWWGTGVPSVNVVLAAYTYVGMTANFTAPGRLAGIRAWIPSGAPQPPMAIIWDATTLLPVRAYAFRQDVSTAVDAWLHLWFRPWFRVNTTHGYRVAALMGGGYHRENAALTSPITKNGIQMTLGFQSTAINPPAAAITSNTNANGVDFLFYPD